MNERAHEAKQSTLGAKLKAARQRLEISQAELGRRVGVSRQAIQQLEREGGRGGKHLARIADELKVSVEWLLSESTTGIFGPSDILYIPILSWEEAAAFTTSESFNNQFRSITLINRKELSVSNETIALIVNDDSMHPEFNIGDKIIIDTSLMPNPGDFVLAALLNKNVAVLRRIKFINESIESFRYGISEYEGIKEFELHPLNKNFPVIFCSLQHQCRIIGTAVEHRRLLQRKVF